MNPSDAFIAPVTYFGYSLTNAISENIKFTAIHVTEIKLRQNNAFEDTGQFLTKRLGVTASNTNGTTVLGVQWETESLKLESWDFHLPELFNRVYFQGDAKLPQAFGLQPFLSLQFGKQFDVGERLLGQVEATAYGVQLGAETSSVKGTYAINYLPKKNGHFRKGGLLSPYSFATDANSPDGGLTLKESAFVGLAHKWIINRVLKKSFACHSER